MGGVIGQKDSTTAGLPSRPLSARRWEALAGRQSRPHHGLLRPRSVLLFSEIQSDSQLCGQKRGFEGRRLEISRSSVPKLFLSFSPIRNPNRALISRKKKKTKRLRSNMPRSECSGNTMGSLCKCASSLSSHYITSLVFPSKGPQYPQYIGAVGALV
jgi:hypothetical protein